MKTILLFTILSLLSAVAPITSFGAGTKKAGDLVDSDDIVIDAWQNMSSQVATDSPWAKSQFASQSFKDGVTNALHKKIAMFIIPVNSVVFKEPRFSTNTVYEVGEKVIYDLSIYKCRNHVAKEENTSWDAVKDKFDFYEHPVIYKGFELKGTITNFQTTPEIDGTLFYSQSEFGDGGRDEKKGINIDAMRMYVESYHLETDGRKYKRIHDTIIDWDSTNTLMNVTVLVDVDCLIRNPEGKEWLYENNEDLFWTYTRTRNVGHEEEIGSSSAAGGYKPLWRPIMPVKWFKELPNWARQD